jgi:SAM-dependent methyltransferase
MKNRSLLVVVIFLLVGIVPSLASATVDITCPDPLLPDSIIAGSTYSVSCSLDNKENVAKPIFVKFEAMESTEEFPVWLNDFSITATINSTLLNCIEKTNGTFYCYSVSEGNEYELNSGISTLHLNITSKLNLQPSDYDFSLSILTAVVGAPTGSYSDSSLSTDANNQILIDAPATGASLQIQTSQSITGASINITSYNSTLVNASIGIPSLNKYIEIEASQEIKNNLEWVIIKVYYTDSEVSATGIDESTLRLYYYNDTTSTWTAYNPPNGGVDTSNNYVWANTTHLSLWGVFGNSIPPIPSPPALGAGAAGFPTKSMSISSEDSITIAQGESQALRISVTNNATALYDVVVTLSGVDSSWFAPAVVGDLARGQTKEAKILITIPSDADIGDYAAKIVAKDGAGYFVSKDLTITVIAPAPTPTTTTIPTQPTTTTIPPTPGPSPITGFIVFVSSPLGTSLLLTVIIATVLILVFYKKWYIPRKIKKVGKEIEERDKMIHDVDEFERGQREDDEYNEMLRETLEAAKKYYPNAKIILEFGAGTGLFTELLVKAYTTSRLIICEPDLRFFEKAREKFADMENVELVQARAEYYEGMPVDLLIGAEAYHHIPDNEKRRFFDNQFQHLKDNGFLIIGDNFLPHYDKEEDRIKALHKFWDPYIKAKDEERKLSKTFKEAMQSAEEGRVEYKTCRAVMEEFVKETGFKIVECIILTEGIDDKGGYAVYVLSK